MKDKTPITVRLLLTDKEGAGPVRVDLMRFARFNHAMNLLLKRLVDRWSHAAAPGSTRAARGFRGRRRR